MHDLNVDRRDRLAYMRQEEWPDRRMFASAHLIIARDGETVELVPMSKQAYHAGRSMMSKRSGCNAFTIGIELIGHNTSGFTFDQYAALASILYKLQQKHGFTRENIQGHDIVRYRAIQEGIKAKYKYDPSGSKDGRGLNFDWSQLHKLLDDIEEGENRINNGARDAMFVGGL
jgi:N-acetyl-anhydromuramyl-L-alanine amidase AmpD